MPREIDRKLRLTAALLGAITRKDLAKAFRSVNAATPFDVDRAHKWLQGRARPREQQLYDDWAKLLDLGRSGQWIAECDSEAFLDAICVRHQRDRDTLRGQIDGPAVLAGQPDDRGPPLVGTYACYRQTWSPYFHGQLMRTQMSIAAAASQRLSAIYTEILPTGRLQLDGFVTLNKRALNIDVRDTTGEVQAILWLFPPAQLVSVLAGFMCGSSLIGPEPEPSITRIAMVRLPGATPRLRDAPAYLEPGGSVAEDLQALGMAVAEPALVDQRMVAFLRGGEGGGIDQIASSAYRALADLFDRSWLVSMASTAKRGSTTRPGLQPGPVSLAERRARGR